MENKEIKKINTLTLAMLTGCPHCATAKVFLKKYGIKYEELNWSDDSNNATFDSLGIKTVPVLLIPHGDKLEQINGENAIADWAKNNRN